MLGPIIFSSIIVATNINQGITYLGIAYLLTAILFLLFTVKDRKKNRMELLTIPAVEFIRRFLLHSLPKRFVRIRHYGFLSNRNRSANLNIIRKLMGLANLSEKSVAPVDVMVRELTGIDITACPCCKKGKMHLFREIPKGLARPPNHLIFVAA
jgi:hypothetical protein